MGFRKVGVPERGRPLTSEEVDALVSGSAPEVAASPRPTNADSADEIEQGRCPECGRFHGMPICRGAGARRD